MKSTNLLLSLLTGLFFILSCSSSPDHVLPENPDQEDSLSLEDCDQCIVLTEQQEQRIVIADASSGRILWQWTPRESNIAGAHYTWFTNPDEAKPVYNNKYLLITASGGGVAIVRIADKKTLFYENAGENPHSAELLPDGNLVSVSSTDHRLTLFQVDSTFKPGDGYQKTIEIQDGHNVVWDQKRKLLWATSNNQLKAFRYNNQCAQPDLTQDRSVSLPGGGSHDLFPVYGEDALWLSQTEHIYQYNIEGDELVPLDTEYQQSIKSISSGPEGFPTIIMQAQQEWWSDQVLDLRGNVVFREPGLRIYKARWFVPNTFSYPAGDTYKQCE